MSAVTHARASFPLMPAEVFEAWLAPLIQSDGWPFLSDEPFQIGNWSRYLLERTPAEWAAFTWRKTNQKKVPHSLHRLSLDRVSDLMRHGMHERMDPLDKFDPPGAAIIDSKHRYFLARAVMMEIKRFPGFVTAYQDAGGKLTLVDGHHRLAALTSFPGYKAVAVPFWIAQARI
jgi:hypothetical protein